MPTARVWLSLVAAEDQERWVLYTLGGEDAVGTALNTVERADVGSMNETWTTLPSMPNVRTRFAAFAMKNGDSEWAVHVVGGLSDDGVLANTTSIYTVDDGNWTEAPGYGAPLRHGLAATTICWTAIEPKPNADEYWWYVLVHAFVDMHAGMVLDRCLVRRAILKSMLLSLLAG